MLDNVLASKQDSAFSDFANSLGDKHCELALLLYRKFKDNFGLDFTINFDDKYGVWDKVYNGKSATFNTSGKNDYIIRLDFETAESRESGNLVARLPLPNCGKYMHTINDMPEYVKNNFRYNDCKCCQNNCPYVMVYTFEGIDYKQCHFLTIGIDSAENIEHVLMLICAEHDEHLTNIRKSQT